ncbi:MAG TPA: hypothetical protein VHX38_02425 [Pseudonocardiaceae bacterium]|jgi:hypothetical protein|nr:hypothetical protein [Pseudonocardiaceae bacterium]
MTAQESAQDTNAASLVSADVQPASEPQRRTQTATCSGCDARWTGSSRAHCTAPNCHRTFATAGLFDRHRRGFACIDPTGIDGMELRDGLWRSPEMTEEQRAAAAERWSK